MSNKIHRTISHIIDKKVPCLFISPHLDDAVLSAGDLISFLADKTEVTVLSVFTECSDPPYTLSTWSFLNQCGYQNARKLFSDRRKEDHEAVKRLGARSVHLGFTDAAWRKKIGGPFRRFIGQIVPEFIHLYPTYHFHIRSSTVAQEDAELVKKIEAEISSWAQGEDQRIVFCPLAIESHIDHLIIRDVCLRVCPDVVLWSDFPYNQGEKVPDQALNFQSFAWEKHSPRKTASIDSYKSQSGVLFRGRKVPLIREVYYIPHLPK